MASGRQGVPARDRDLEYLAGLDADKRHSTKQNVGPKFPSSKVADSTLIQTSFEAALPMASEKKPGVHSVPVAHSSQPAQVPVRKVGKDDDESSYVLEEIPSQVGRATDVRLAKDSALAARCGIDIQDGHMGALLAGSNVGNRAMTSPNAILRRGMGQEGVQGPDQDSNGLPKAAGVSHGLLPGQERPVMPLADFKRRTDTVLTEFFSSSDFGEARTAFNELAETAPFFAFEFVYRAIRRSMERTDKDRELVCRLVSSLCMPGPGAYSPPRGVTGEQAGFAQGMGTAASGGQPAQAQARPASTWHVLTMEAVGQGFERALESLDDIMKDVPRAREMMARFLARAVADEILPPAFLEDRELVARAPDVVATAQALLAVPHAAEKLEHAWNITGADSIEEMKDSIKASVSEYYTSGDVSGPVESVRELSAPYFGHEVAYRVIITAMDKMGSINTNRTPMAEGQGQGEIPRSVSQRSAGSERSVDSPNHKAAVRAHDVGIAETACSLLQALRVRGLLTETQALKGVSRVHDAVPDLCADDPRALTHLGIILGLAAERRVLPASVTAMTEGMPNH